MGAAGSYISTSLDIRLRSVDQRRGNAIEQNPDSPERRAWTGGVPQVRRKDWAQSCTRHGDDFTGAAVPARKLAAFRMLSSAITGSPA